MNNNKGSIVIEASLVLPLFIFFILALYSIGKCKMAELEVYEACAETVEYMAEYGYISDTGAILPTIIFDRYVNNTELIDRYVAGGKKGVIFPGCEGINNEGYTILRACYDLKLSLPFLPALSNYKTVTITQKVYDGNLKSNSCEEYVFVTAEGSVYHRNRACSYLMRDIIECDIKWAENHGYSICEMCGNLSGELCETVVYITEDGGRFHTTKACSSLKRNVYREKLSELRGMKECHLCKKRR